MQLNISELLDILEQCPYEKWRYDSANYAEDWRATSRYIEHEGMHIALNYVELPFGLGLWSNANIFFRVDTLKIKVKLGLFHAYRAKRIIDRIASLDKYYRLSNIFERTENA